MKKSTNLSQRKLTRAEALHLLYALDAYSPDGSYYGDKEPFVTREKRLRDWLTEMADIKEIEDAV